MTREQIQAAINTNEKLRKDIAIQISKMVDSHSKITLSATAVLVAARIDELEAMLQVTKEDTHIKELKAAFDENKKNLSTINNMVESLEDHTAKLIGAATSIMIGARADELEAMLSVTEQPTQQPNDKKTN